MRKRFTGSRLPFVTTLLLVAQFLAWAPLVPAQAQLDSEPATRGFANGVAVHATGLQTGTTRLVNLDVGQSSAIVDADTNGVGAQKQSELERLIQPTLTNKLTYANGQGLNLGIGATLPSGTSSPGTVAGTAEQSAPPNNTVPDVHEVAVPGDPLVYASLVRGWALAHSQDNALFPKVCFSPDDLAKGIGYAADVEALDTGGDNNDPQLDAPVIAVDDVEPDRSASETTSRTFLRPQVPPGKYSLVSEVRQTIAPVTLLQDDDHNPATPARTVTIEVLGLWVLRVEANGQTNGATVHYGPEAATPETPIIRIIDDTGATNVLTFQDVFDNGGLTAITVSGGLQLHIGEDPRAIVAPGAAPDASAPPTLAGNGTVAAAATDVVRVLVGQDSPAAKLVDIRIGHMEAKAQVPVGGVNCPPGRPTLISPSGGGITNPVTYTWTTVPNATDYQLFVDGPSGNVINTTFTAAAAGCASGTGNCQITPTTTLATGPHTWWVRASNAGGNGPWSTSLSFVVGVPPNQAPTLISPTGIGNSNPVTYRWNSVPGATDYNIFVTNSSGATVVNVLVTAASAGCASGGVCASTPSATLPIGPYTWWVRGRNGAGNGPWSLSGSFTVGNPPAQVTTISPSGGGVHNPVTYTWNAVSTASDYVVFVTNSSGATIVNTAVSASAAGCPNGTGTCSTTPATVLAPGSYTWWARGRNAAGNGSWSTSKTFTVS